jgi:hypothetical protein
MEITISLNDEEYKLLKSRAKKNLLTIKEQVEDIIRRSCLTYKKSSSLTTIKTDDRLVEIFSRAVRKRKKKKR